MCTVKFKRKKHAKCIFDIHLLVYSFFCLYNWLFLKGDNSDDIGVVRTIANSLRQSDFYVDPVFNVILGVNFAFGMVWSGWHSFLVPHALQRGISVQNTIIIIFSAAIGDTLSSVAAGVLTNSLVKPVTLYLFATILNIAALLCDVYFVNYYVMLSTSCISAMSIGVRSVVHQLVVRDRASPEKFDVAYAVDHIIIGFGVFLGGYLCGKESLQSYLNSN